MANTISSTTPVTQSYSQQQAQQAKQPAKQQKPAAEDTVQLSKQAQSAKDVDHDGDSH